MATLPDPIKIDDITSGRIEPQAIHAELERLKSEINVLRSDMSAFLKALATVAEHQSQQSYYDGLVSKVNAMKSDISEFCAQYNRLLPIINLTQIKLGHEVEVSSSAPSGPKGGRTKSVTSVT
ncbi:hypothetical protein OXX59_000812 [Metschnikowia pulcherrima]